MAIPNNGAQMQIVVQAGGEFSQGTPDGDYHVVVADAQLQLAKTSQRPLLVLELQGKDDPNHPGKEGKKILVMRQVFATPEDPREKQLQMAGMLKRICYDGFGVKWPDSLKNVDARAWIGKTAYIRVGRKTGTDGKPESYPSVMMIDQKPLPPLAASGTVQQGKAVARSSSRR